MTLVTKSLVLSSVGMVTPLDVVCGKGSKLYYDSSSDRTGIDCCVSHKPVEAIALVLTALLLGKHRCSTARELRHGEVPQGQGAMQVKAALELSWHHSDATVQR